jgi:hypothetical protein
MILLDDAHESALGPPLKSVSPTVKFGGAICSQLAQLPLQKPWYSSGVGAREAPRLNLDLYSTRATLRTAAPSTESVAARADMLRL